ncbi:MAG: type II toxin-antitoxin system HicB family antitoxin [Alphaproteobacteria bacterium]|jgi:antitoxin HicB
MTRFIYPVRLTPDEDGRVVVEFPDFDYALTDGADVTEALHMASDCLETALAHCINTGKDIPEPSALEPTFGDPWLTTVAPGPVIAAKAALYTAMRAGRITKVGLAAHLAVNEGEVRRWLDPRHATKIATLDRALASLGKRLEITVSDAPHDIDDDSTLDAENARERRARIPPGRPPKKSGLAERVMNAGGEGRADSVKKGKAISASMMTVRHDSPGASGATAVSRSGKKRA